MIGSKVISDIEDIYHPLEYQQTMLKSFLYCLRAFDRTFKISTSSWNDVKSEILNPKNLILKRVDLIPKGMNDTMSKYRKGRLTQVVWKEAGFQRYFDHFKKLFQHHLKMDTKGISILKWVKQFLESLIILIEDVTSEQRKADKLKLVTGYDINCEFELSVGNSNLMSRSTTPGDET